MHDSGDFLIQMRAYRLYGLIVRVRPGTAAGENKCGQVIILLPIGNEGVEVVDNLPVFDHDGIRGLEPARTQPFNRDRPRFILIDTAGGASRRHDNKPGQILGKLDFFCTHDVLPLMLLFIGFPSGASQNSKVRNAKQPSHRIFRQISLVPEYC